MLQKIDINFNALEMKFLTPLLHFAYSVLNLY